MGIPAVWLHVNLISVLPKPKEMLVIIKSLSLTNVLNDNFKQTRLKEQINTCLLIHNAFHSAALNGGESGEPTF